MGKTGNGFGGVQGSLTPSLDSLADRGVLFDRAYCTQPQCQPARWSIMTGRMPSQHGVRWNGQWEPRDQYLLTDLFRDNGYTTATIGKHHFDWLDQPLPLEDDFGFDYISDISQYYAFCFMNGTMPFTSAGHYVDFPGLPISLQLTGYTLNPDMFHPSGYWANSVISYLEDRAADNTPFFLFYSPYGPHTPLLPSGPADPNDWANLHRPAANLSLPPNMGKIPQTLTLTIWQSIFSAMTTTEWKESLASYYGQISQIDFGIGRVLTRLEELGLAENTLVIYTADHGEMSCEMSVFTKGAGNYEAVSRVPYIISLPNVIPRGQQTSALNSALDLFPTIADLTGLTIPKEPLALLEGRSIVEAALEAPRIPDDWRTEVFVEFGINLPNIGRSQTVIRQNDKFLVDDRGGLEEEYYDLVNDPWEMTNLVGNTDPVIKGQVDELRQVLATYWNDEIGHMPFYKIIGSPNLKPARAIDPLPRDGAMDMSRDTKLKWVPSLASGEQEVWFGQYSGALTKIATLGPMADKKNLGPLAPDTNYFWRIDGINPRGKRVGTVWTFRTGSNGDGGPELPMTPSPARGEDDVSRMKTLTWTPPAGAASQDLYFATGSAPFTLVAQGLPGGTSSHYPGRLDAGTKVRWLVDAFDASGRTRGDVWTYTVSSDGLALPASAPTPPHLEAKLILPAAGGPVMLTWTGDPSAKGSLVYFGTDPNPPLVGRTVTDSYEIGRLDPDTTYWWRVDVGNRAGMLRGPRTWRFTTAP